MIQQILYLSEALVVKRRRLSYTQKELARFLGISQSYVHQLENGKKVPSLSLLLKISDFLQIDAGELIKPYCASNLKSSLH